MNVFEEILQQVNILDIIQSHIGEQGMKRQGKEYGINPCPFCGHNDCFKVDPAKGVYHCFSCDKSGHAINFVQDYKKMEPLEAAKEIARACGLKVDFSWNGKPPREKDPAEDIRAKIFNEAAIHYQELLLNSNTDKALKILKDTRKYSKEFLEKTPLIGYTGNQKNSLFNYFRKRYSEKDLLASGLIVKGKDGKLYDFFGIQYFIFFHLVSDQVCDFSVKDALKHQRKKPREMESYRLKVEYRLHNVMFFNQNALTGQELIFVEGQHDVLQILNSDEKAAAVGDVRALADPDRVDFLRGKIKGKTVYLAFDKDEAGERYVQKIFENFWGDANLQVLHWERKEAKDIDEFLRKQADPGGALGELMKNSMEIFNWLITFTVEESEDTMKTILSLKPFTDKFSSMSDSMMVDVALESIKRRFENASIGRIISETIKKDRYTKETSGPHQHNLPYFEEDGIYWKVNSKSKVSISNFVLRIEHIVIFNDEVRYLCTLINEHNEIAENVEFEPIQRVDKRKFSEKLAGSGRGSYYFTGNMSDLSGIWQYEERRKDISLTIYVNHYGEVRSQNMWIFDNCVIKKGQIFQDRDESGVIKVNGHNYASHGIRVYSNTKPVLNLEDEYSQDFVVKVSTLFNNVVDMRRDGTLETYQGLLLFGFLPATIYSYEIAEALSFFPLLFAYGQAESSKSTVLGFLNKAFGWPRDKSSETWDKATPAGTYQMIEQLSSLAVHYDEFLNNKTFEKMLGTVKSIFDRVSEGKGNIPGKARQTTIVNGTYWLSGQDNPMDEAVLSRSVMIKFPPKNDYRFTAWKNLNAIKNQLSVITRELILKKTPDMAAQIIQQITKISDELMRRDNKISDRVAKVHAVPAAALIALNIELPPDFMDFLVKHALASLEHKFTENPVYIFFSEILHLQNEDRKFDSAIYQSQKRYLAVHFPSAIRKVEESLVRRMNKLPFKITSIKDALLEHESFKGECVVKFGSRTKRCMTFNINDLPADIKEEILFSFIEE